MNKRQAMIEEIPRLRRFARALTRDTDRADDLVQDCLERALSRLDTWQTDSNMRAWLFTILRNLFYNQQRSAARRGPEISYDENAHLISDNTPAQETGLYVRDLQSALDRLEHHHREAILLVAIEGMRYQQAADIIGVPTGTLMSRLSRARQNLKNLMEPDNANADVTKPTLRRIK